MKLKKKKRREKTPVQLLEAKCNTKWNEKCAEKWGNEKCEICGDPFSAFHHFIEKSRCTLLRYDVENGVPVCVKCHYIIHNSHKSTEIQDRLNIIEKKRGKKWREYIRDREHIRVNKNIKWLNEQLEKLEN